MNPDTEQIAITTKDNPYDYWEDFSHWYMYDCEKGYSTCEYLARLLTILFGYKDEYTIDETNTAIDEMIKNDFLNNYVRIKKNISN